MFHSSFIRIWHQNSFTQEILVTMFRDQRVEEYDNKDWFFVLEDVKDGKRKPVAQEIKLI